MLKNFSRPKIEEHENTDTFWFQQNGATAHITHHTRAILQVMIHGHLISLREDIGWAPRPLI